MSEGSGVMVALPDRLELVEVSPLRPTNLESALSVSAPQSMRREAIGFVPLRDQVLVRRCTEDEMNEAQTLWIPEQAKTKQMEGIVIAVGSGRWDNNGNFYPTELAVGDRVLFGRYDGTEYKLRGEDVMLMKESSIVGILR